MTNQKRIDALVDQTAQELWKAGYELNEDTGWAFDRACAELKIRDEELTDEFYDDFRDTWELFLKSHNFQQND